MKNAESKIYRMYGLVPYNISPIQQSIQYGHAVVEYLNKYFNEPDCTEWRLNDKTFIILNGGTTNKSFSYFGTLNKHQQTLKLMCNILSTKLNNNRDFFALSFAMELNC